MPNSAIPNNCLVVVTTGAETKLFRANSAGSSLKLIQTGAVTPDNLDDEGPSGSFVPESSDRETDEATFAKQLAKKLYDMAHAGEFEALALIADPDTLGEIRPLLHKEVTDKIIMQLNKTLINSAPDEIAKSLTAG